MARKRPRKDVDLVILPTFQDKEKKDEFANFGKTVADTLRKLPRMSQIQAKKKINDILFEAEMEAMSEASVEQPVCNV